MILEKQKEANVLEEGQSQESIGMSLDLDSAQVLMQMLSKNLYSDAIGSTIRECASNALDSHRRAGTTDPIIVSLKINNQSNYEFSVEDFGIGLDADDVRGIISKYGKSTKRDSANELGMMGLGFKAPLAYCSSFYFVCRKNGVERKYMMYEGEDVNTIDMLYEKPTTERNGVKIIVPVKYGDRYSFQGKIKEQLAYFESVFFDCGDLIDNNFQIIRHEHFQWSPLSSDHNLHICLDNVYYSLDFNKLDIKSISFPIALKFGLSDGIFPTPNRESIRYTKEAKEAIMKKLELVANYFVDKYNESVKDTEDVFTIIEFLRSESRTIKPLSGTGGGWSVSELKKYATKKFIKPKLKGIELLDMDRIVHMKDYLLEEWVSKFSLNGGRLYSQSHRAGSLSYYDLHRHKHYYYTDKLSGIKKDWIRATFSGGCRFIKREREYKLGTHRQEGNGDNMLLRNLLQLSNYPKSQWRQVIEEFRKVQAMMMKDWMDLDQMNVPQTFIDARKKTSVKVSNTGGGGNKVKRKKLFGEVIGKKAVALERYHQGNHCKWVSETIQMRDAHKSQKTIIYGSQADAKSMDTLFWILNKHHVNLMLFSQRELNVLKNINLHNWISMADFLKGEHKIIRRVATSRLIFKLIGDYRSVFKHRAVLTNVSTDLRDKLNELEEYADKHHMDGEGELLDSIVALAEQNNLFDPHMYYCYKKTKALLEKLTFLKPIFNLMSYRSTDEIAPTLRDLFRYYKHKMDLKYYVKMDEEAPVEADTIDELVTI